jgi:hypothetical protein
VRAHILSACTRPHNLPALAESIEAAACEPWEVCWHIRFDSALEHVGGQRLKNQMIDQITDGWVCFLDDDTTMHPEFLRQMADAVTDAGAVVVSQWRENGQVLVAAREHLKVGSVDIGQAFIARALIGAHRIPEHYEGDGEFLAAVLRERDAVAFLPDILSRHNALDWIAA